MIDAARHSTPVPAGILQLLVLALIWLVAGSTFGIWRGYDPATWPAATFVVVHQGTVRGLNILLPAMGLVTLLGTLVLAIRARLNRPLLLTYAAALVCVASAAAITRLVNQPINADIMQWSADAMPVAWADVRDRWWTWHVVRMTVTICGALLLTVAIDLDRNRLRD